MKAGFHKWEAMGNPFILFVHNEDTDPSQLCVALLKQVKVCQTGHEGDNHWDMLFLPDLPEKNMLKQRKKG